MIIKDKNYFPKRFFSIYILRRHPMVRAAVYLDLAVNQSGKSNAIFVTQYPQMLLEKAN